MESCFLHFIFSLASRQITYYKFRRGPRQLLCQEPTWSPGLMGRLLAWKLAKLVYGIMFSPLYIQSGIETDHLLQVQEGPAPTTMSRANLKSWPYGRDSGLKAGKISLWNHVFSTLYSVWHQYRSPITSSGGAHANYFVKSQPEVLALRADFWLENWKN